MTATPLDALPRPGARNVAVRVRPAALRTIRAGHPWIYDESVVDTNHDGAIGDLAVVFDDRRRFAAIGLWDPTSPLRVRVLHHGDPRPIDADFFAARIAACLDARRPLVEDAGTTGWRVVNGESDGLPGLVVDRYGTTAVVRLDTAAWLVHLGDVVPALVDAVGLERVVLRASRSATAAGESLLAGPVDGVTLLGDEPAGPVPFLEAGLHFAADVVQGQKTGHFLDQRDNRIRVGALAAEARVLDVFCCTGGFSVHAAAGGARAVHSIDLAAPAVATARDNMARNDHLPRVRACDHTVEVSDAFEALAHHGETGRRWDVVVIDPPSFAPRRDAVAHAMRAYRRLTELGLGCLAPGGVLVQSSCSSRVDPDRWHAQILDAVAATGRRAVELDRTAHGIDHPATIPEARYLKTSFLRID